MENVVSINRGYKDLKVWKKSIDLVEHVYKETQNFPKEEIYGLTSQIRRSAVSVPSNIAEGSARRSNNDFIRFINIAYSSLSELETQLYIANRLGYLNDIMLKNIEDDMSQIGMMLNGLRNSLQNK